MIWYPICISDNSRNWNVWKCIFLKVVYDKFILSGWSYILDREMLIWHNTLTCDLSTRRLSSMYAVIPSASVIVDFHNERIFSYKGCVCNQNHLDMGIFSSVAMFCDRWPAFAIRCNSSLLSRTLPWLRIELTRVQQIPYITRTMHTLHALFYFCGVR